MMSNLLDTMSDVLAVANTHQGCPCEALPHISGQDHSRQTVEMLTAMIEATGDSTDPETATKYIGHVLTVAMAVGYAVGADEAYLSLETTPVVPDHIGGLS